MRHSAAEAQWADSPGLVASRQAPHRVDQKRRRLRQPWRTQASGDPSFMTISRVASSLIMAPSCHPAHPPATDNF